MFEQQRKKLGARFKDNELLSRHTTFRLGGPAKFFAIAENAAEIQELVEAASAAAVPYYVLGGGSNVLTSDGGFDGLVIKIQSSQIDIDGEVATIAAGTPLALAINKTLAAGLTGLEWAIGIPGTIGGAVRGNAGAYGGDMSASVETVDVWQEGRIDRLTNADCVFGYRQSVFNVGEQPKGTILSVRLRLKKASAEEMAAAKRKISDILQQRLGKFSEGPSAGSIFKNVMLTSEEMAEFKEKHPQLPEEFCRQDRIPAAWLIDECNLRGKAVGGAKIADSHAGIIINRHGKSADVVMLMSIVKQKVRSQFSIQLNEEIELLGF